MPEHLTTEAVRSSVYVAMVTQCVAGPCVAYKMNAGKTWRAFAWKEHVSFTEASKAPSFPLKKSPDLSVGDSRVSTL